MASDLPDRESWGIHSPEYAWDIAGEMNSTNRRRLVAAWLSGDLRSCDEMEQEAAIEAFWAHASDLLRPTVSSSGIDAAVRIAVLAAWGVTDE